MRISFRIWATLALTAISSVLSAPTDADVPLKQLTQADFSASVAQGLWLIEFFSPYCVHCKKFKPTWKDVVEAKSTAALSFSMAQVDCIAQGDLCQEQSVPYYPFIRLFKDGVTIETYNGDRSFDDLSRYIDSSIAKHLPSVNALPEEPPEQVSEEQTRIGARSYNTAGEVLVINGASQFDAALAEGPLFVKMFAPWCGHCKKLAPAWKQLASNMQGRLNIAEVDCDDNPDLCRREAVEGYPTLLFYQNNRKLDYRGARKLAELEAYSKRILAAATGLQPLNEHELDDLVRNEPAFFLYLHDSASTSEKVATDLVRKVAIEHAGGAPIYSSSAHSLFEEFSVSSKEPVLISIKDHLREPSAYFFLAGVVESDVSEHSRDLDRFLLEHRFASSFELTSDNFQEVMRGSSANVVVLAPITRDQSSSAGQVLAASRKAWESRPMEPSQKSLPALFVWMDFEKWEEWLGKMYGITKAEAGTRVILADHKRLVFYDGADGKSIELTQAAIIEALQQYGQGVTLKHSEGLFARSVRRLQDSMESFGAWLMGHIALAMVGLVVFLVVLFALMERMIKKDVYVASHSYEKRPLTSKSAKSAKSRRLD